MRKSRGFTALETIVSICILSIVGLAIGQMVLQIGRSSTRTIHSDKATTLSAMVLEQYKAYAVLDFSRLANFDQELVTPQAFFRTPDNLGYDSMRITTHTLPRDGGGAVVTVVISWGKNTTQERFTYTQSFGESAGRSSGNAMSGI